MELARHRKTCVSPERTRLRLDHLKRTARTELLTNAKRQILRGRAYETVPEFGYELPGSVRQLRKSLERAVIIAGEGSIASRHLPPEESVTSSAAAATVEDSNAIAVRVGPQVHELEKMYFDLVLKHARNNRARAAEILPPFPSSGTIPANETFATPPSEVPGISLAPSLWGQTWRLQRVTWARLPLAGRGVSRSVIELCVPVAPALRRKIQHVTRMSTGTVGS